MAGRRRRARRRGGGAAARSAAASRRRRRARARAGSGSSPSRRTRPGRLACSARSAPGSRPAESGAPSPSSSQDAARRGPTVNSRPTIAATSASARPGPVASSRTCSRPSSVAGSAFGRRRPARADRRGHDEVLGEERHALAPPGEGVDGRGRRASSLAGERAHHLRAAVAVERSELDRVAAQTGRARLGIRRSGPVSSTSSPVGSGRAVRRRKVSTAVSSAQWRSSTTQDDRARRRLGRDPLEQGRDDRLAQPVRRELGERATGTSLISDTSTSLRLARTSRRSRPRA